MLMEQKTPIITSLEKSEITDPINGEQCQLCAALHKLYADDSC